MRNKLGVVRFKEFQRALAEFKESHDIKHFISVIDKIVPKELKYVLVGIYQFISREERVVYRDFLRRSSLPIPEDL